MEGSLKRLQTDHLDVLLLHRPDALMEPDEVAEAFTALETSGKVRYFGVSNFNSRQLELLQSSLKQKILVNQLQLSIMPVSYTHLDVYKRQAVKSKRSWAHGNMTTGTLSASA